MLPADLRRGERYWRWSFGARPYRELGRMCPELAGELGTLELGELLWDEFPPTERTDEELNEACSHFYKTWSIKAVRVAHLSGRSQVWTCSPAWGSVATGYGSVSRGRSPLMRASDLSMTGCGWCGGETPAW